MSNGQPGITLSDSLSLATGNPELSSVSTATVNIEPALEIFNVRLVFTWIRKLSIILLIRMLSVMLLIRKLPIIFFLKGENAFKTLSHRSYGWSQHSRYNHTPPLLCTKHRVTLIKERRTIIWELSYKIKMEELLLNVTKQLNTHFFRFQSLSP